MQKNIILAGVGGQGILSIAYVIDNAALDAGYHFKQAEVHGMAQRGGAVQSHLRYADTEIYSDLIPEGMCDLVLAVEPLEVLRYWHYLQPDGWVVSSVTPYVNIPDYPEMDALLEQLSDFTNLDLVDTGLLAKAAGNLRAQNMVAVGAGSNHMDFTEDQLLAHVESLFARKGEKIVAVNQRAFRLGRAAGAFYRGLVGGGLGVADALKLVQKIDPDSLDAEQAKPWAAALTANAGALEAVLAAYGKVGCADHGSYS
jgi:indolepyruvate ferredoxin oxidoreductase beta subunit